MRISSIAPLFLCLALPSSAAVTVNSSPQAHPRERLGVERLRSAVDSVPSLRRSNATILAGVAGSPVFARRSEAARLAGPALQEAFRLKREGNTLLVIGGDPSGVLYGCLELARRIQTSGNLPGSIDLEDRPQFVLRGPAIGMQKTIVSYDGAIYDYRYTPEEFPFFYDRDHWTRYLDFLLENRMNTLYLWNGHPFTSLLKLPKYPDAQELTDQQLDRNIEMFRWLTAEADRRGIWVIQLCYNIHISHALAKARGIGFHHSAPTPLTSDYMRYCVSEFIRNYPNVGLLLTLGEALAPRHGPEWLAKTIIPGVQDGMKQLGITKEPPIIVRAHATEIEEAMRQARPLYGNIFTMHKWNGESLTWTDVRGDVRKLHEHLVSLGSTHISNVHILANLEPFRWGSPDFVQKTMQSTQRLGIKGLHLYPLRYWDWPVTADNTPVPLKQIDRDWIWYEAWARYAWNPVRAPAEEREYWIGRLAAMYGSRAAGEKILDAYQAYGVCAPRLLPRIGITEGNRQAFSLGMLMTQLINPERYNAFRLLWLGDAPEGERLPEYAAREFRGEPHTGETPVGVAAEVAASAAEAVKLIEAAAPSVSRNKDEYLRLANDIRAVHAMMRHYDFKTRAAALVLRYGLSRDPADLQRALPLLEESVAEFRRLLSLTDKTYREACSVHSGSRRIPMLGGPGRYTHWRDTLPLYEQELAVFRKHLQRGVLSPASAAGAIPAAWPPVTPRVSGGKAELFRVEPGAKLYTDAPTAAQSVAPELAGMTGIRIPMQEAREKGVRVEFDLPEPAQVLVGFFRSSSRDAAANPPKDEWEPVLFNGVSASNHPGFTVYSHAVPAGRSDLDFGRGAYVVLGFVKRTATLSPRMVFLSESAQQGRPDLDWLFETN